MVCYKYGWFNGGTNSCIDYIVVKDKLRDYLNIVSVCNSYNDISDHLPFL